MVGRYSKRRVQGQRWNKSFTAQFIKSWHVKLLHLLLWSIILLYRLWMQNILANKLFRWKLKHVGKTVVSGDPPPWRNGTTRIWTRECSLSNLTVFGNGWAQTTSLTRASVCKGRARERGRPSRHRLYQNLIRIVPIFLSNAIIHALFMNQQQLLRETDCYTVPRIHYPARVLIHFQDDTPSAITDCWRA